MADVLVGRLGELRVWIDLGMTICSSAGWAGWLEEMAGESI